MKSLTDIADALQGYDPQALHAGAALQFLHALVQPVQEHEPVPVKSALGRVLACDLVSPINVPAHDNSAMDGYAFDGAQLHAGALRLAVVGTALAGAAWGSQVGPGQCLKIMTGATLPPGLDTVVPQEMVYTADGSILIAPGTLAQGDNRRLCGEDLQQGRTALAAGRRLGPADLGLIASLGIADVSVWRRPKVAYFSTGDEILSLGEAPREGAVYDSNRYTLFGLLSRLGVDLVDLGVVKDEPTALRERFASAAQQADAIITSGGVSVGEADHTKAVMRELAGGETGVAFWKIAMRPGRPMAVGRIGKAVLFGLPGNPVAVMVTFLAFVRPALLHLMGCQATPPPLLQARTTEAIRKKPGRTEFQRAWVFTGPDGGLYVQTTGQQGSGVLSSMSQANGLIVLEHHQGNVGAGETVRVMVFEGYL